jgi:hypothetical protein
VLCRTGILLGEKVIIPFRNYERLEILDLERSDIEYQVPE